MSTSKLMTGCPSGSIFMGCCHLLAKYNKGSMNSITNMLGTPLHVELINTLLHPHSLRACIQVQVDFNYPWIFRSSSKGRKEKLWAKWGSHTGPRCRDVQNVGFNHWSLCRTQPKRQAPTIIVTTNLPEAAHRSPPSENKELLCNTTTPITIDNPTVPAFGRLVNIDSDGGSMLCPLWCNVLAWG